MDFIDDFGEDDMSFASMLNDTITIIKSDGRKFENIKASVQPPKIYIFDEKLPLEESDIIQRLLPNGLIEDYVVEDPGFHVGIPGIPGNFQATVRRQGKAIKTKSESPQVVYNFYGDNARINNNSTDKSVNQITTTQIFKQVAEALKSIPDETVRKDALAASAILQADVGTPQYQSSYEKLMASVADHMSVLGPLIPALMQLLK